MEKPFYILSLDGGGVKGLITISFLAKMEEYFQSKNPEFKLYEHFDMFAGTSIGALISMLITIKKYSAKEIADIFSEKTCKRIMNKSIWDEVTGLLQQNPKYDGKGKTEVITENLGDAEFSSSIKPLLIPTYDITNRIGKIFISDECDTDLLARDLADASSACPAYFPCVKINSDWFIDGGVIANNPTVCAISEAYDRLDNNRKIVVINIGTGYKTRKINGEQAKNYGGPEWLIHDIIGITMDESIVVQQATKLLKNHTYICVNNPLIDSSDELDNCYKNNIKSLIATGEKWWEESKYKFENLF